MLIGVLGDSHHQTEDIDKCIKELKMVNLIIHTGDMISDANYITEKYNIPVIGVSGNCDPYIKEMEEFIYDVNDTRIFICHGHNYGVKSSLRRLILRGKEVGSNIVIFGHTHIPLYEKFENIHMLNPGSIAYPRGQSNKSMAILEIKERISIKHVGV